MATIAGVSASELIRTSTFGTPVITELNTRCVKVTGTTEAGGFITGSLILNVAGAAIRMRRTGDNPYFQFENSTGATQFATIQGTSTAVIYNAVPALSGHTFRVASVDRLHVDADGVSVGGRFTATGVDVPTGGVKIGGNGAQLSLVDTSTSGSDFHDVYMNFYGQGVSMVSPGVRSGWVGYSNNGNFQFKNEVLDGDMVLTTTGSGTIYLNTTSGGVSISSTTGNINLVASGTGSDILLDSGTGGAVSLTSGDVINFSSNGTFQGRVDGRLFLWGKAASAVGTPGVELIGSFDGLNGQTRSTIGATGSGIGVENLMLNRVGPGDADGAEYITFMRAGSVKASITARASAGVEFNEVVTHAPSDYRWKDDLGPVEGALDRMMKLRPRHVRWKGNGVEADEFMAHEVATVFPELVKGTKDAVTSTGAVDGQSLNTAGLLPDVVAAIQELAVRLEGLEGN